MYDVLNIEKEVIKQITKSERVHTKKFGSMNFPKSSFFVLLVFVNISILVKLLRIH